MALSVREYETADGKVPFRDWLATLDRPVRARIQARVLRFESGNLGVTCRVSSDQSLLENGADRTG